MLLLVVHDVLPGSAIAMVYDDAEKIYNHIAKESKDLIKEAFKVILPKSIPLPAEESSVKSQKLTKGRVVTLNTVHAPRREVIPVDLSLDALGGSSSLVRYIKEDLVQLSRDGKTGYVVAENSGVGFAPVTGLFASTASASAFKTSSGDYVLANENIKLTIAKGRIVSLYDVALDRELIAEGQTGGLAMFDDRPTYWDAWDTEVYDVKSGKPIEFAELNVKETGPAFA